MKNLKRTVDQTGRVSIPKDIREMLNLDMPGACEFVIEKGKVYIQNAKKKCAICGGSPDIKCTEEKYICTECAAIIVKSY